MVKVFEHVVHFRAGATHVEFFALRTGPDMERITDDDHLDMKIYEYLGAI